MLRAARSLRRSASQLPAFDLHTLRHGSSLPLEKEGKVLHPELLNQQVSACVCICGTALVLC